MKRVRMGHERSEAAEAGEGGRYGARQKVLVQPQEHEFRQAAEHRRDRSRKHVGKPMGLEGTAVRELRRRAREEIFGPVMQIFKFATDDEAVQRANDTNYGLAAGVFSTNGARALGIAHMLRAGTVWINTYNNADVRDPPLEDTRSRGTAARTEKKPWTAGLKSSV